VLNLSLASSYDYVLPPGHIARYPTDRRDRSRLLVLPRGGGTLKHLRFDELPSLLRAGDLLVVNESRVLPVRLLGRKPTGAACEVLLLRPLEDGRGEGLPGFESTRWEALVRPGAKLKPGRTVEISPELRVVIEGGAPGGGRVVRLESAGPVTEVLERVGRIPLPPYLQREAEELDRERYQTVYAREPGSVAAPTAGLHFTDELLGRVAAAGVGVARVTLHVGPGTFRPVDMERLGEHEMHRESWRVSEEAAQSVRHVRASGGRVWAVGTTVVRTLESAVGEDGAVRAGSGETDLFIHPGFVFRAVDGMITNFHLPRSTLLMLVAAFAGHGPTLEAYATAVEEGYRFYSYGDAMIIPPAEVASTRAREAPASAEWSSAREASA